MKGIIDCFVSVELGNSEGLSVPRPGKNARSTYSFTRHLFISLILVLALVSEGEAQWKKIADFRGFGGTDTVSEYITCVYFLDLPGPPRIGFVGTASELYRTSDGGGSWSRVWGDGSYFSEYIQCVFF